MRKKVVTSPGCRIPLPTGSRETREGLSHAEGTRQRTSGEKAGPRVWPSPGLPARLMERTVGKSASPVSVKTLLHTTPQEQPTCTQHTCLVPGKTLNVLRVHARMHAQLCPTLCHPMGYSPRGFSVHGILQARILEWVAISFSNNSYGYI